MSRHTHPDTLSAGIEDSAHPQELFCIWVGLSALYRILTLRTILATMMQLPKKREHRRDADSRFGEMLAKYYSKKKPVLVYYDNSGPYGVIICAHNNNFYWQQLSSSSHTDKRGGSFPTNMTPRNRIFICMPIWVCGMVLYYNCSTRQVLVCCRRGLVQASTGHAAASRCYFAVWYCVCRIWI